MKLTFETPTMSTRNKNAKLIQCTHETAPKWLIYDTNMPDPEPDK